VRTSRSTVACTWGEWIAMRGGLSLCGPQWAMLL
jgi:hypothetical protein